jgi:hypothetical protein
LGSFGEVLDVPEAAAALLEATTPAFVEMALTRNGKAFACSATVGMRIGHVRLEAL